MGGGAGAPHFPSLHLREQHSSGELHVRPSLEHVVGAASEVGVPASDPSAAQRDSRQTSPVGQSASAVQVFASSSHAEAAARTTEKVTSRDVISRFTLLRVARMRADGMPAHPTESGARRIMGPVGPDELQ